MARRSRFSQELREKLGLPLDLAIAAVLLGFALAAALTVLEQHRFDAASVAEALARAEATRVALPWTMRPTLDIFLERGITPILYDRDTLSPQSFALQHVDHVVAVDEVVLEMLESVTRATERHEAVALARIDRQAARSIPLLPGRSISWEYARPYRYAPLSNSLMLGRDERQQYDFMLETGSYEFRVEAFSNIPGVLDISVKVGDEPR
jgi:hypothetical protein